MGGVFVCTCRTSRRSDRSSETFDQIGPGFLVATFASDNQAHIVGLHFIDELVDGRSRGVWVIAQEILLDCRCHAWGEGIQVQRTAVRGARDQPAGAVVYYFRNFVASTCHRGNSRYFRSKVTGFIELLTLNNGYARFRLNATRYGNLPLHSR